MQACFACCILVKPCDLRLLSPVQKEVVVAQPLIHNRVVAQPWSMWQLLESDDEKHEDEERKY